MNVSQWRKKLLHSLRCGEARASEREKKIRRECSKRRNGEPLAVAALAEVVEPATQLHARANTRERSRALVTHTRSLSHAAASAHSLCALCAANAHTRTSYTNRPTADTLSSQKRETGDDAAFARARRRQPAVCQKRASESQLLFHTIAHIHIQKPVKRAPRTRVHVRSSINTRASLSRRD